MATPARVDSEVSLRHGPPLSVPAALQVAAVSILALFLYGFTLFDLARDWWTQPSLSYGLLVPPLALYFAWLNRGRILGAPAREDRRGLYLIGLACAVFILGKLGAEFFLMRTSFVLLLVGIIWAFWGPARLRTLAFPLVLLAAAVPLPVIFYNRIAVPLQLLASNVATQLSQFLGISVYRDGNIIYLANISLGVEEACSGLNSLSSLVVGSLLLGNLMCRRLRTQIALFVLSIPLAIGVNVLRVTGTAVLGDYKPEFALGFYHSFSGWLVFVVGILGLFLAARLLCWALDR
jgi:exosortase